MNVRSGARAEAVPESGWHRSDSHYTHQQSCKPSAGRGGSSRRGFRGIILAPGVIIGGECRFKRCEVIEMIPIGDENRAGRPTPVVTYLLIAVNVLVFFYEVSLGSAVQSFIMNWGAVPAKVLRGDDWLTLVSSMFIHGGWMHLIGNMLFLKIFGDNVEDAFGHGRFLLFYLVAGFVAHAANIYVNPHSMIPTVGASGAISGVLGAYIIMFRSNRVRVFWGFFVSTVPAWLMIGLWAVQQFLSTWAAIAYTEQTSGVAYAAHVGGFVAGVLLTLVMGRNRRDRLAVPARY
jgi:membrane associated rhomboid family serine protease